MNDHKDINKYLKEKRKREIKEVVARAVLFILATVILVGLRLAYKVVEFRIFQSIK